MLLAPPLPSTHHTQEKLNYLREQIEMRVVGLSWSNFTVAWSSSNDETIGTVSELQEHLKGLLDEEQRLLSLGSLPSKTGPIADECPTPQLRRKTFKMLGTPTVLHSAGRAVVQRPYRFDTRGARGTSAAQTE